MSESTQNLEQVQCWMQDAIMCPDGAPPLNVDAILTHSRALSAADRLAIYHSAYHARLIECLREEYSVLCRALGQELFDGFAFGYLQSFPSRSYTLCRLGANFASYLADTRPQEDSETWPDFLIDLARLEWAFAEIFDGPGAEGQLPFDATRLTSVPTNDWSRVCLQPVSCLRLFTSRYPIQHYFLALKRDAEAAPPEPAPTFLALTRIDYRVRFHELDWIEFLMLEQLVSGKPVEEALKNVVESSREIGPAEVGAWFQRWAENRYFTDFKLA